MKSSNLRRTSFLTAFAATALLTAGCGSSGIGDILGGGSRDRGPYDSRDDGRYDQSVDSVRGTVERVNTTEQYIVVDGEGTSYRNDLRNGRDGDDLVLYYDDRTVVEHQGRTYRPQDLESGDRIVADVEQSGSRLIVEEIEVLYDVTSGTGQGGSTGGYDDRDDNYRDSEVRGTVRAIDTRDRTLEIERSRASNNFSTGTSGDTYRTGEMVEVHYDSETRVEFQGRTYAVENLERGDLVEVEIRDQGGRLHAEEILVLADNRAGR
jgi:Domain of unknown function (DUF5666)